LYGNGLANIEHNNAHVLVNTVDSIKDKYTVEEYSDAHKAWFIQDIIRRPGAKDYVRYLENNMMPNCPITKFNIMHAEDTLGPNLGSMKGKRTTTKPSRVIMNTCTELSMAMACEMTLAVDIMYINEIPFVITMSWAILFGTT